MAIRMLRAEMEKLMGTGFTIFINIINIITIFIIIFD
jgi:hypothetical protein